jgi:hypothetical protein
MMRYMGKSNPSKNTKKRRRSRATNAPNMAVSRMSIEAMYAGTCFSTFQDARMASGMRNAVSRTSNTLMPSTPRM